jgi:uncharacterized protein YqiB (DUF1249 family)
MMNASLYKGIHRKLYQLIPDLDKIKEARKLKAPGFMDLNIDILQNTKQYKVIALSHYWKHESGDMIPDPDMEIRIYKQEGIAEALAYQDLYRYDRVYNENQEANLRTKASLNEFLDYWLGNLLKQGFK